MRAFTSSVIDALKIDKLGVEILEVKQANSLKKTYRNIDDGIVVLFQLSFSTGELGTSSPQVAVDAVSKRYNDQVESGNYTKILQDNAKIYNSAVLSSSYSTATDVVISTDYEATVLHTSKPSFLPSSYPTKQPSQQPSCQPSSHPSLSKVSVWNNILRAKLDSVYNTNEANQDTYYRLSVENTFQLVPDSWNHFVHDYLKVAVSSSKKNISSLSAVEVNDVKQFGLNYLCSDRSAAVSIATDLTMSTVKNSSFICEKICWNVFNYGNFKSSLSVGPCNSSSGDIIHFSTKEANVVGNGTEDGLIIFVVQYSVSAMSGYDVLYSLLSVWFIILMVWAVRFFDRKFLKKQKNIAVVQPLQSDTDSAFIQAKLLGKLDSIFVGIFSHSRIETALYASIINCSAYLKPLTCSKRSHCWGYCLYLSVRACIIYFFVVLLMRIQHIPYSDDCSKQISEQACTSLRSSLLYGLQSCVWRGQNGPSVESVKPCTWIDTAAEASAASVMRIITVSLVIALFCRVCILDALLQRVILASIGTADPVQNHSKLSFLQKLLSTRSSKRKIFTFESLRSKFSSKEEFAESVAKSADGEGNDIRQATRVHSAASFASGKLDTTLKVKINPSENFPSADPEMQVSTVPVEKEFENFKSDLINCCVVMKNSYSPDLSRFLEHWALDEGENIVFDNAKFTRRNIFWIFTNGNIVQSVEQFFLEYIGRVIEDSLVRTDKDDDLLRLFVFDLIGRYTASATILQHTIDMANKNNVHYVRKEYKIFAILIMAAINGCTLALSLSFSAATSSAWVTTTIYAVVAALMVDVVISDFIWTLWISLVVPLSIAGKAYSVKSEVLKCIGSLIVKYTYSAPPDDTLDIPILGSNSSESFNASKYFFVSSRVARDKPASAERDLVMSYETIFPAGIDVEDWVHVDDESIIFVAFRSFYHTFTEILQVACQLPIFLQQILITLLVYAVIYGFSAAETSSFSPLSIGVASAAIASVFIILYVVNEWPRFCRQKPTQVKPPRRPLSPPSEKKEDEVSTAKVHPIISKDVIREDQVVLDQPPPHSSVASQSPMSSSPSWREIPPLSANSYYKTNTPSVYDLSDSDDESVQDLILNMGKIDSAEEDSDARDPSPKKMSVRPFSPLEKVALTNQHPPPLQVNAVHLERKLFELKDSFMNSSSDSSPAHSPQQSSHGASNDTRSRISVSSISASNDGDSISYNNSDSDFNIMNGGGSRRDSHSVARSNNIRHKPSSESDLLSVDPALKYYPVSDSSGSRRSSSGDDSLST